MIRQTLFLISMLLLQSLKSCWAQFWVVFRNEFLVISMYDSESGVLSGIWILYDFGLQHLMLRNLPSLSLMFPPKIDVSTVLREAFAHQNFTVVFDTGSGNLIVETQVLIVSETSLRATDSSRPALTITLIVIFFWFGDKVPGKDCTSDASNSVEFRSMPCFYAHKVSCIENIGMQHHWPNFSPSLMHFNCLIMISGMFQHYLHLVPPQFPTNGVEACNSHKRFDHLHGVLVSSETWVNLQLWNRSSFFLSDLSFAWCGSIGNLRFPVYLTSSV